MKASGLPWSWDSSWVALSQPPPFPVIINKHSIQVARKRITDNTSKIRKSTVFPRRQWWKSYLWSWFYLTNLSLLIEHFLLQLHIKVVETRHDECYQPIFKWSLEHIAKTSVSSLTPFLLSALSALFNLMTPVLGFASGFFDSSLGQSLFRNENESLSKYTKSRRPKDPDVELLLQDSSKEKFSTNNVSCRNFAFWTCGQWMLLESQSYRLQMMKIQQTSCPLTPQHC